MDAGIITILLPLALAIIMMGLGFELTLKDFVRVSKYPKAIFIALFCQLVILVAIAFILAKILNLPPLLAVGLMLLAASPGGPTANIFSYLFKGDIALNISLTAINSVVAAFSLPFIVNLALLHFMQDQQQIGLQLAKVIQVFVIILLPVIVGMLLRHYRPQLTEALNRPFRVFSIVFLVLIIAFALFKEKDNIMQYMTQVGLATALFCIFSLAIGYSIPRLFGVPSFQARACAFEIGIHNSTLAMTIALSILSSTTMAMPAAVYSIFMYIFATAFGFIIGQEKQKAIPIVTATQQPIEDLKS
ncbi:bile acid:sodium symporter family protein [Acinetobacter larvae]|uniref:Bile acid:sodium symporter n=1 Tax=Acinetobacter larvae TaxID=1789224 RepID=A0A1B2LZM7_9GAMM|nr:bile acid:sodium symporter family protein [Acinetobacter larvae]AOA58396.1 bile acid:sodium symporter [Acinetobacter larvae]